MGDFSPLLQKLGKKTRQLRKIKGLSTSALAKEIGLEEKQIYKLEQGAWDCDVLTLFALSEVFDIDLKDLFLD